jgi:hypothetical protein
MMDRMARMGTVPPAAAGSGGSRGGGGRRAGRRFGWLPIPLLLAACAAPDGAAGGAADGGGPGEAAAGVEAAVRLDESCTNETYGFRVHYPRGWRTNDGEVVPACSVFDPRNVSVPPASEMPTDIAIVIALEDMPFEATTRFADDPSVTVLSTRETTVAGRRAVVAEFEHTGWGLFDAGHRHYAYHIDVPPSTLIGATHGDTEADPPAYPERRRILDAMMARLEILTPR